MDDIMKNQAGKRIIGQVWVNDSWDNETVKYVSHFADANEFGKFCLSKVDGSTTKKIVKMILDNQEVA